MLSDTWARRRLRGRWRETLVLGRERTPLGPRNTYSNLSYVVAGLVTALLDPSPAGVLFGFFQAVLGWGSWRYHADQTVGTNKDDRFGMFAVFAALAVHGYAPEHAAIVVPMAVAAVLLGSAFTYVLPLQHIDAQMGLLLGFASIPAWLTGSPLLAGSSLTWFALGYACWHLDRVGEDAIASGAPIHSHPIVGLWGHALWHVFTAVAIPLMYFAQETRRVG